MPTMHRTGQDRRGEAILTAIDESVVVLRVRLSAIAFPAEMNSGNTLRAASTVVVESDFSEWANGGVEQFLNNPEGQ
jgi:hypothetical protein